MIKLSLILLGSLVAFFILPGILAAIAGFVFIAALFGLVFTGLGYVFSAFGSVVSTVFGALFSVLASLVLLVGLGGSLQVLLMLARPLGMLFLVGCLFCTVVCGVV